jgi:competence protein ComFA
MLFYLMRTDAGELSISPIIQSSKLNAHGEMLLPGLPFVFAEKLVKVLEAKQLKNGKREISKFLLRETGLQDMDWHWVNLESKAENQLPLKKVEVKDFNFTSHIQGRQLSEADLQRLANELGLNLKDVIQLCYDAVLQGQAEWIPAVQKDRKGWHCMRCGETEIKEWPSIYGLAGTCPSCASLGTLTSLQALYRNCGHDLNLEQHLACKASQSGEANSNFKSVTFTPHWALSVAQERASQEVLAFIATEARETSKSLLLWAACGAGKTEVCFPATAWALERGLKVLFAAPRQDVVLDVVPRLERDFPGVGLSVLTGVSNERFTIAPLVLATTHQVLRFFRAFDLIFMDEVDAFPYFGNEALAWGLQHALKPGGKIVYLTATPSSENMARVQSKEMKLVRLPARHHRNALPVPEWIKYSSQEQGLQLCHWVKSLVEFGPVLIFVPKISWVDLYVEKLRALFPGWIIEGSYSSDPGRRKKIERLRMGKYPIFITTSILERGVTIPNAQVIVLEANHEIFDERALVQMAGRVGRTRENPKGKALFLAQQKTPSIEKAIHWIQEQNKLAFEQGLID